MKKGLLYLLHIILISSCTVDFNPRIEKESECLVINSLLQPDSVIIVRLHAAIIAGNGMEIVPLKGANVILKENSTTIYNGTVDDLLVTEIYPQIGLTYSIEVTHPDYTEVRAETSIPQQIYCNISYDEEGVYTLSEFNFPESKSPMWITASALFTDKEPLQYGVLYCNNLLIDNINREEGSDIINKKIGSGYHQSFLRIKEENQARISDILFLPTLNRSIIWENYWGNEICIIATSKEYDQYCKTFYQLLNIPISHDISAILYQPVHVYSNINGGLGIFAGKSEVRYFIEAL